MDVQQWNTTQAAADEENPTGLWASAPSLAATTVKMTNTSGFPVRVYCTGGASVTVIKVNDVTTGAIAGSFYLRRGDNIALTYTSTAPTVKWFYA
jgi:hypothetical protein